MRIQIILKGWYQRKLWDGETEAIPRFGFVAVNKKRVLIDHVLNDGDVMHVYHKMNGG